MKKKLPSPLTILLFVVIIAALATWLIPAGKYDTLKYKQSNQTFVLQKLDTTHQLSFTQNILDSLGIQIPIKKFSSGDIKKAVSVPGSYQRVSSSKKNVLDVLQAPLKGIADSFEIILFILIIGGFMHLFNESGAMISGLTVLSQKMNGKESWLIITLTFLFSLGGATFGMAEEGLVFYAIMVPLFIRAGYDLLVPVAVIFGGTQLGTLSSITNPFSTIIASDAAGVNWTDGIYQRLIIFIITTVLMIVYIVRYASKVKREPKSSLVYKIDGILPEVPALPEGHDKTKISNKEMLLLIIFGLTFLVMIVGVTQWGWWLMEMSTLFFASSLLIGFVQRIKESLFIERFIKGAEGMLGVALIVGTARGVSIILTEGNIADTIIYNAANLTSDLPPMLFIVALLFVFIIFTLFIASSSGMAVLTMPIMGSFAMLMDIPGREIVNAYLYGMGIMGFITPTGLILPSLALVNVSIKTWLKFIAPFLWLLIAICIISLLIGIYI